MKHLSLLLLFLFTAVPSSPKSLKKVFEHQLASSTLRGIMFGHHDDTIYGYTWSNDTTGRSDTKDLVGKYPAMMSFDLSSIEKGSNASRRVAFSRKEIIRQHARGGFSTVSWHAGNVATGGNAWDTSDSIVVRRVLPGGDCHEKFIGWLDYVADFFLSLKDENGQPIPVIFRPWHEGNGNWFWWGSSCCSPEEYKHLWKMTVKHMKRRGVKNVIYAYSVSGVVTKQEDYLMRYPGDKLISVWGFERYSIRATASVSSRQSFIAHVRSAFDVIAPLAAKRKKILAFTETGAKQNTDTEWWTRALLPALEGYPICFLVIWRNATHDDNECYGIYKGHPAESDFVNFANNPRVLLIESPQ